MYQLIHLWFILCSRCCCLLHAYWNYKLLHFSHVLGFSTKYQNAGYLQAPLRKIVGETSTRCDPTMNGALTSQKREHAADIVRGTWPTTVLLRTTATTYGSSVFSGSRLQSNSSSVDGLQILSLVKFVVSPNLKLANTP